MIFICKSYDKDIFSKFRQDPAGLWYNERLENEIIRRKNYVSSRSANKKGKKEAKIISSSYDSHMENENETINNILIEWGNLIVDGQDQFWDSMKGRKVTKSEMNTFLSVAVRNKWKLNTQQSFRIALNGFSASGNGKSEQKNKYKIQ